jgi:hypothetical protein
MNFFFFFFLVGSKNIENMNGSLFKGECYTREKTPKKCNLGREKKKKNNEC